MHNLRRKKYMAMSLRYLEKMRHDIQAVIDELEALPEKREIDIAADHAGDPEMIHEVLEVDGDKDSGKWRQLERIYCSPKRCSKCPHGPIWFTYRANKKDKTATVVDFGIPVFDYYMLREMRKNIRPPVAVLSLEELQQARTVDELQQLLDAKKRAHATDSGES